MSNGGWCLLYNSNNQGLSFNRQVLCIQKCFLIRYVVIVYDQLFVTCCFLRVFRFQHHVMDYKGASVMLVEFAGFSFCLAVDEEWRFVSLFEGSFTPTKPQKWKVMWCLRPFFLNVIFQQESPPA